MLRKRGPLGPGNRTHHYAGGPQVAKDCIASRVHTSYYSIPGRGLR